MESNQRPKKNSTSLYRWAKLADNRSVTCPGGAAKGNGPTNRGLVGRELKTLALPMKKA